MQKLFFILVFIFYGCSKDIPTPSQRYETAQLLAQNNNLKQHSFKTSLFNIFAYEKTSTCKEVMSIYIEGDGFSWVTSSMISENPTPINPLSLKLMIKDISTCKVYLARPCQYIRSSMCKNSYWSSHRFSAEVIQSYLEVLDELKKNYNISTFKLYGFSGGGTVATLLSAKRSDINRLVTIAGNLDIEFWTSKHHLTPLYGSLNPSNFSESLSYVKQNHLIGENDEVIDKTVYESYIKNFKNRQNIEYKVYERFDHSCCWENEWTNILNNTIK